MLNYFLEVFSLFDSGCLMTPERPSHDLRPAEAGGQRDVRQVRQVVGRGGGRGAGVDESGMIKGIHLK